MKPLRAAGALLALLGVGVLTAGVAMAADGSLDTSFDPGTGLPGAGDTVNAIALQPDGKILIGGRFASYNGVARAGIARLNSNGSLDNSFDAGTGPQLYPGVAGSVSTITVLPGGKILVGGDFYSFNGASCAGLIRLEADGAVDAAFVSALTETMGVGMTGVKRTGIRENGQVWLSGGFSVGIVGSTFINGNLQRLNSDGRRDSAFAGANYGGGIFDFAEQPDGRLLVGGGFGGSSYGATNVARLNPDGSRDPSFSAGSGPDGSILAVALQRDLKLVAGGLFSNCNGTPSGGLVRFNSDGSVDSSFAVGDGTTWKPIPGYTLQGQVSALALQSDGKVVMGGSFNVYKGVSRVGIARVNTDGSLDTSFDPGTGASGVSALAIQPDGRILIGGMFTTVNGTARAHIARLAGSVGPQPPPGLWSRATRLADAWNHLPWFGFFNTAHAPWIYHAEHGWLYPIGNDTSSIYFYDPAMKGGSFWWSSESAYPYIYRLSDGAWLWYYRGTSNPRFFSNLRTGATETW